MIRDGKRAFVGSQSLRRLELEKRREVGIIITDENVIADMQAVFARDWAQTDSGKKERKKEKKAERRDEKDLAKAS
jgi:phosphatidylserine/phosphatidylglycerophosphate/cardiolipin synthase-like enzyme